MNEDLHYFSLRHSSNSAVHLASLFSIIIPLITITEAAPLEERILMSVPLSLYCIIKMMDSLSAEWSSNPPIIPLMAYL